MLKRFAPVLVLFLGTCLLLLVQLAVTAPSSAAPTDHKVLVCHVPPGNQDNAHIIDVDESAWLSGHTPHNGHPYDTVCDADGNDCLPCSAPTPTPTQPTPQ